VAFIKIDKLAGARLNSRRKRLIIRLRVNTKSKVEFQDITSQVQEVVRTSGVEDGTCYIFVPHTTAAITVNEHDDPSVVLDISEQLNRMVPQQGNYRHLEGNAPAHVKASLVGSSQVLLIEGGKLSLGTWQGLFFCEFDGPRQRAILIKLVSD
jgi:secondary thiamine-phosphate synthase enzyme